MSANERPILFSGPMVNAYRDGRKTKTRRVAKMPLDLSSCPYGQPGDYLWVRESWKTFAEWDIIPPSALPAYDDPVPIFYPADCYFSPVIEDIPVWGRSRSPIHMPRWASRITLEILNVRVEPLQDITDEDAIAEGVLPDEHVSPRERFRWLWESINGYELWASNPLVWVIEFPKHRTKS